MNIRRISGFLIAFVLLSIWPSLASVAGAVFSSGSTEADGALSPAANTVLQVPESGVFNFTTVNIPSGVTVTFTKNTGNTPVTILATGNVVISGAISVNGSKGTGITPGAGGRGGYDGGRGGTQGKESGIGQGPGGGNPGMQRASGNNNYAGGGGGGSFGTAGVKGNDYSSSIGGSAGQIYGNESILPLIGGSGGGAGGSNTAHVGFSGGGGGGAILIASSGTITISGSITANGGESADGETESALGGGGSGGAIRLIANTISGNGTISATGGNSASNSNTTPGGKGGDGRIRLEAYTVTRTAGTTPGYTSGLPSEVVPADMPTLSITQIGGVAVPATPTGSLSTPDVTLPTDTANPISVDISATNIPVGTIVTLTVKPEVGSGSTATATLSGTFASSSATLSVTISRTYPSTLTISTTYSLASNEMPIYAEGERVESIRVASVLGGRSMVTYVTESGREIQVLRD
ncbi:MAG: hypothetical protein HYV24_02485 [Deltaproteobacteria bacterium]|nr:hypothetical protein [Deltaproteobacteria bacterium]